MKAVALMYHDAVEGGHFDESGFVSEGAHVYKLDITDMAKHFSALARSRGDRPGSVVDVIGGTNAARVPFFLTFDDGGVSAATLIAPLLDRLGWVGHFFITGSRIDTEGFVSARQVRDLHERGHVIGSHSWSHPERMSKCSYDQLMDEWTRSLRTLGDIIEAEVRVASVPGGYFSEAVARAASACGIRALFTSEPVKEAYFVGDCLVLGRFGLQKEDPPALACALAAERLSLAQVGQSLSWNARKLVKALAGEYYLGVRGRLLARRQRA